MSRRWLVIAAGGAALALAAVVAVLLTAGGPAPVTLTTAQIAARLDPAVVDITATAGYQHTVSAATGLVLTPAGVVLTNNHVIAGATVITARDVGNGRSYQAAVVGYDARHDLAVLRLRHASGLAAGRLAAAAAVSVGDRVVALGNAEGAGGTPAAAAGRVTGLGEAVVATDPVAGTTERLSGLIRSSARVRAGFSGGPLASAAGQVIGITTAAVAPPGQQPRSYAIPAAQAAAVAGRIRAGTPSAGVHFGATAFLGVALLPHSRLPGAAVGRVVAGSPAARAGLTAGAVITALGGRAVTSAAGLRQTLMSHHPGDRVSVRWTGPAGRAHRATVILAAGPAA